MDAVNGRSQQTDVRQADAGEDQLSEGGPGGFRDLPDAIQCRHQARCAAGGPVVRAVSRCRCAAVSACDLALILAGTSVGLLRHRADMLYSTSGRHADPDAVPDVHDSGGLRDAYGRLGGDDVLNNPLTPLIGTARDLLTGFEPQQLDDSYPSMWAYSLLMVVGWSTGLPCRS